MSRKFVVGLDIGTTKVCALVAKAGLGGQEIMGWGMARASGLDKGVVVDMDAASEAIGKAVSEAEISSGVEVKAAYVGVAGSHVKCLESYGATGIKGKEVTKKDVDRAIDSAAAMYVPLDREVLHVLPAHFVIDGQDGIVRPEGMSGVRLEARVRVITASQPAVDNLVRCCERAGVRVIDTVFEPVVSSQAVLRPDELSSGVVIVDIGGGTTDIAVYRDGTLRHASVLAVGGNHITNDIAIGLKLSRQEAEKVKEQYGRAAGGLDSPGDIDVTGMNGRKKISAQYLTDIVVSRCEEIFELIRHEIWECSVDSTGSIPACVVLTGGTALLKGIERVAETSLGLPVRVGVPENGGLPVGDMFHGPVYSTCVGLMLHGLETERGVYEDLLHEVADRVKGLMSGFVGSGFRKKYRLEI